MASPLGAFNWFDRVYVVHLPHTERQQAMRRQLERMGITRYEFVHAARPPDRFHMNNMRRAPAAEFGANLSHLRAVTQAISDRAERPLFLEDDIETTENGEEHLASALLSLPKEWDVLYLGGHPRSGARMVGEHLAAVGTFSFAEAYSIRGATLSRFVEYWLNRITQPCAMYDFILGEFAARHNGFAVYPVVTFQPPNWSHIGGGFDDKRALVERGWQNNLSFRSPSGK